MEEEHLIARVEEESGGDAFLVRAPAVGVVSRVPDLGMYLNPLQVVATLRVLGRRHVVQLPRHVHGRVAERFVDGTHIPVEYDEPLFRLQVRLDLPGAERRAGDGGAAAGAGPAEDLIPVPAPSDGIFYRRPSPGAAPYVEKGSAVSKGTVLGLVEVMKCFNQIVYGAPGLPEKGTVVSIGAEDASEVRFGQPLFQIRPDA